MTFADVLTDHEKELVEQLKREVAPIVERHPCLQAFCIPHTYVRYLRARCDCAHRSKVCVSEEVRGATGHVWCSRVRCLSISTLQAMESAKGVENAQGHT